MKIQSMPMGKIKIKMGSEKYFNDPDEAQEMRDMGFDVIPVDSQGAFVPENKDDGNLGKMQDSIRERFNLGEEEE